MLYRWLVEARNWLYDTDRLKVEGLPVKVMSVGNLTVGGTGKTPLVIDLAERMQKSGIRFAILSRGYRRQTSGFYVVETKDSMAAQKFGDEPTEIARRLPGVPVGVCEDRVTGGRLLFEKFKIQVLLLDDGFQHRRLKRDLDVVVVDTTESDQGLRLLPFGRAREPWEGLRRADWVVLSKTNLGDVTKWQNIVRKFLPDSKILQAEIRPRALVRQSKGILEHPEEHFSPKRVVLVSGIGNPAAFETMVKQASQMSVLTHIAFGDHQAWSWDKLVSAGTVKNWQSQWGAIDAIVTTAKDAVRVGAPAEVQGIPLYALEASVVRVGDWSGWDEAVSALC